MWKPAVFRALYPRSGQQKVAIGVGNRMVVLYYDLDGSPFRGSLGPLNDVQNFKKIIGTLVSTFVTK